ncbi:hypothetical protein OQA88_1453 [Cercophora sp. LCS_1]
MSSGDPNCHLCNAQFHGRWSRLCDVKDHAEDGCPYCTLMDQALAQLIPDVETKFGYDASFRFKDRRDMVVYADANGSIGYDNPNRPDPITLTYQYFNVTDKEPCRLPSTTLAEDCFTLAKEWLQDCLTSHPLCGTEDPSPLPTRILDVDHSPTSARLIEPTDEKAHYIALSHSWGNTQPLTTTLATLPSHKESIPLSSLPQTFHDAVAITRRLGIRYLWIDSLCIIQDSPTDWAEQASLMSSTYSSAHLTLSATASSSPFSGIFRDNLSLTAQISPTPDPLAALFPEATLLRQNLRLYLSHATSHVSWDALTSTKENKPFPLLTRGWTYQERLLSPRVLHYGPRELFWECMQDMDCHCGKLKFRGQNMGMYASRSTTGELPPKISHYAALHAGSVRISEEKKKKKLMERWEEMVGEYTRRVLTYRKDRLVAFEGVVGEMERVLGMNYVHGLWEETLPAGLLWERVVSGGIGVGVGEERFAPSWSWAAVEGEVRFLVRLVGPYDSWLVPRIRAVVKGVEGGAISLEVETVRGVVCFEGDGYADPYVPWMRVSEGINKGVPGPSKGKLRKGSFMVKVGKEEPVVCVFDTALCGENGEWLWKGRDDVQCAKIMDTEDCHYWLVLRRLEGGSFERLGVIGHPYANWESNGKKQVIKIV